MTRDRVPGDPTRAARERVAIILAAGVSICLIVFTAAVLYDAVFSEGPGLSENATQILTASFSGIIGALAGYLGGWVSHERRPPGGDE
jgi:heme A synthase